MSTPESDPAAVFGQPVSPMDRLRDSVATQPQAAPGPFRSVRTGWAAGRQQASEDNAAAGHPPWATIRPQTGRVGIDFGNERAATVDQQGPDIDHTANNADAPASQESLDALHQKVSDLQGSVSGMSNSGGAAGSQGGQYRQSGTPGTPFATPVSPIQQQAEKHQAALAGMLAGRQNLAQVRARFSQNATNRAQAAQGVRVNPSGSGNAASSAYNDVTMSGALGRGTNSSLTPPSGLGSSAATWDRKRFLQ
jgi:hypothetical protein